MIHTAQRVAIDMHTATDRNGDRCGKSMSFHPFVHTPSSWRNPCRSVASGVLPQSGHPLRLRLLKIYRTAVQQCVHTDRQKKVQTAGSIARQGVGQCCVWHSQFDRLDRRQCQCPQRLPESLAQVGPHHTEHGRRHGERQERARRRDDRRSPRRLGLAGYAALVGDGSSPFDARHQRRAGAQMARPRCRRAIRRGRVRSILRTPSRAAPARARAVRDGRLAPRSTRSGCGARSRRR